MTPEQTRAYVKNHIEKSGHKRVTVTPQLVVRWWNLLNTAVFYGKLLRPTSIKVSDLDGLLGECIGNVVKEDGIRRSRLRIKSTFPSKLTFLNTLVHEMVHMWEYQHHTEMEHRKHFLMWTPRIKRTVNLDLTVEIYVEHMCDDRSTRQSRTQSGPMGYHDATSAQHRTRQSRS